MILVENGFYVDDLGRIEVHIADAFWDSLDKHILHSLTTYTAYAWHKSLPLLWVKEVIGGTEKYIMDLLKEEVIQNLMYGRAYQFNAPYVSASVMYFAWYLAPKHFSESGFPHIRYTGQFVDGKMKI